MAINRTETIVIGGGVVGLSVAVGLLMAGSQVTVVDGADGDQRASHGNFGLVWVQGKGAQFAPYAHWTMDAADLWPKFADTVQQATGIDLALHQDGGYELFTDEAEFEAIQGVLAQQRQFLGKRFSFDCLSGGADAEPFPVGRSGAGWRSLHPPLRPCESAATAACLAADVSANGRQVDRRFQCCGYYG